MSRTEVADSPGKVARACGAQGAGPCAGPRRRWNRIRAAGLVLPLLLGHLLALTIGGGAFYLEVRELEEKCFIQEIPDGTMVIGARAAILGLALPAQSPEWGWGWSSARSAQARTSPLLSGMGLGGKWVHRSVAKAFSPLPVLSGTGGTEETSLIQIRMTAEKRGWRVEERG